jgi:hypothetical protein
MIIYGSCPDGLEERVIESSTVFKDARNDLNPSAESKFK